MCAAADTRTAILDLAEELLQSRSFNAFSYHDIAEAIGIRKASVHYHFPTKEDLGVALVERFRRDAHQWASRLVEGNAAPEEKLEAYFELQAKVLETGKMICALGILGAEYNALPPRLQESYSEFLDDQQRWLTRLLGKGQASGVFQDGESPEDLAAYVQAGIQGGLQIARASGRPDRFHAVLRELRRSIYLDSIRNHRPSVPEES